jgi:hypothetical protein
MNTDEDSSEPPLGPLAHRKAPEMETPLVRERSLVAPASDAIELPREASVDEAGGIAQGSMPDLLADLAERAKADVGAAFEPAVLRQLADRRARDCAAFMRLRGELKMAGVPLGALDKALATVAADSADAVARRPSQATALVRLAKEAGADLFCNAAGEGFVSVQVGNHRETWPVRSKATEDWLTTLNFGRSGVVPNREALQAARNALAAELRSRGREEPVGLRVAELQGRLYIDLCDSDWRAVEIGPDGWQVIANPPIRFWRMPGMLPLPVPERHGSIESLRRFLNVRQNGDGCKDSRFILAVAWLLAALRPRGPYPVLGLAGEHGSAKSSFARVLRNLVDPNSSPLRSLPRGNRDLFITARNSHAVVFDNLSELPDWLSDSLCRLVTGGGFATRQLYTDGDEVLFDAMRPIILNGIEDLITRPDLADRTILLTLDEIPEDRRQEEHDLWSAFEAERPCILGALLDATVHGMKMLPSTKLTHLPRMADFARWVTACEGALWAPGTFKAAYDDNRHAAIETALAADAVATAVRSLMATRPEWEGSLTDLLAALAGATANLGRRDRKWPGDGHALFGRLRRIMPSLRQIGIIVEAPPVGNIRISNIITPASERELDSAAARGAARRAKICSGQSHRLRRAVDNDFARALAAPAEGGASFGTVPAIEVAFVGGTRISISASSPVALAAGVVKALSRR